jgi:hypothetical protein
MPIEHIRQDVVITNNIDEHRAETIHQSLFLSLPSAIQKFGK